MSFYDAIRVGASGAADFEIERSLRYNPADITNLERTFGSASNRRTWTFSFWYKRSGIGRNTDLFSPYRGGEGTQESRIYFQSNDQLRIYDSGGLSGYPIVRTAAKFRDVGAWYHFVIAVDTTQSTASNRIKMYANGVLQELDETTYGNQNQELGWNNNHIHRVGAYGYTAQGSLSSSNINDGYLAEVNFIDGQQLTPSSFGETNSDTGQWVPIDTSGLTFGTNGFRLQLSDNSGTTATTLGKDTSGNGNNFTPYNFSVAAGEGNDSLEDTPTNNFCTMNQLVPSPSVTWANGNLDLAGTSSTEYSQNNTSTFGVSSGKWYVEVKFTNDGTTNTYVGICPIKSSATTNMTGSVTDAAVLRMSNETYIEGSDTQNIFPSGISSGNIIGIALDMDNQKLWFSLQGTYANSGNPATGANAIFSGITAGETMAICARPLSGTLNFNFGQRPFAYTPPTGFKTLCSANLTNPTILLPNKHFAAFTYAGTGSSGDVVNITNSDVDFTPDWVWVKTRDVTNDHILSDSVRGGSKYLVSSENYAEQTDTDKIRAFIQNGFESGTDGDTNWSGGRPFVAWNWNAGATDSATYTVKVVSDSGNKYRFNDFGTSAVTLDLAEGGTYTFDGSDSSMAGHPFVIGTAANGSVYSTGVTYQLDGASVTYSAYTSGYSSATTRKLIITVPASAPQLYYWCSIHSGMGGAINTNSTLGSSNFDGSVQATVKASPTSGFSIVSHTGTGGSVTVGHGLGVAPKMYIQKSRDNAENWDVYTTVIDGSHDYLHLNTTAGKSDSGLTAPTSTVIYRGSADSNGEKKIIYCFSEVAGYSKFGSYTGNQNANGSFVYTGFRPAWVLVKGDWGGNWNLFDNKRPGINVTNDRLFPNLSNTETDGSPTDNQMDLLSNGFKLRGSNIDTNHTAGFIYLAFAESPFKNSRAR